MFPPMTSLVRSLYKPHKTYNSFIRSDEGLTLATSPFWSFCGDNLIHINSFDIGFSCFTPHQYNTTTYIRFQKDDMVDASNISNHSTRNSAVIGWLASSSWLSGGCCVVSIGNKELKQGRRQR